MRQKLKKCKNAYRQKPIPTGRRSRGDGHCAGGPQALFLFDPYPLGSFEIRLYSRDQAADIGTVAKDDQRHADDRKRELRRAHTNDHT